MEGLLHRSRRWLAIHELRFEDVLLDSRDDGSDELLIAAYDLSIGPDRYCEIDGTRLSGQLGQQNRIGTRDLPRRQDENPFLVDSPCTKLRPERNIRRITDASPSLVPFAFKHV